MNGSHPREGPEQAALSPCEFLRTPSGTLFVGIPCGTLAGNLPPVREGVPLSLSGGNALEGRHPGRVRVHL